jgi:hypothetical protein
MFNINTGNPKIRIADVDCSRIQFKPGDRVLVRVYQPIEYEARKKLQRAVEKWVGVDIEVLVYDATQMEINIEKHG